MDEKIYCPFCRQPIAFDRSHLGEIVLCPGCEKEIPLDLPEPGLRVRVQQKEKSAKSAWVIAGAGLAVVVILVLLLSGGQHSIIARDQADELGSKLGNVILIGVVICVYFIPTALASKKQNASAIFLLNLFLGWTLLGWVVALVWAATKDATGHA